MLDLVGIVHDPELEVVESIIDAVAPHGVNPELREDEPAHGKLKRTMLGIRQLVSVAKTAVTRVSTSTLRVWWHPPCTGPWVRVSLHGSGVVSVRPAWVEAMKALNMVLVAYDYKTRKADTGCYNCRPITGGTAHSLHSYALPPDINWQSNPYGRRLVTDMRNYGDGKMPEAICAIRTNNGKPVFAWGGFYTTNKDAMHYDPQCSPSDIATGINYATVKGAKQQPTPTVKRVYQLGDQGEAVKFAQALLNLAWKYRTNRNGRTGGAQIPVTGRYTGQTQEAVRELQRFANKDLIKQGKKPNIEEDGILGPVTQFLLAGAATAASK